MLSLLLYIEQCAKVLGLLVFVFLKFSKLLLPQIVTKSFQLLSQEFFTHPHKAIISDFWNTNFSTIMEVWNSNMKASGEILESRISGKRLVVEWNGWKFGTWGLKGYVYWAFHVRSFELNFGPFGTLWKFPILRFSKRHFSHCFWMFWNLAIFFFFVSLYMGPYG